MPAQTLLVVGHLGTVYNLSTFLSADNNKRPPGEQLFFRGALIWTNTVICIFYCRKTVKSGVPITDLDSVRNTQIHIDRVLCPSYHAIIGLSLFPCGAPPSTLLINNLIYVHNFCNNPALCISMTIILPWTAIHTQTNFVHYSLPFFLFSVSSSFKTFCFFSDLVSFLQ